MKRNLIFFFLLCGLTLCFAQKMPNRNAVLRDMKRANTYFMKKYADPTLPTIVGKERPSNIWTRGVYYEGLMAFQNVMPEAHLSGYAICWGLFHKWNFNGGNQTENADNLCCGQTYTEIARLTRADSILAHTDTLMAHWLNSTRKDYWTWIDAIQMAMPLMAQYGCDKQDIRFFRRMMELYRYTRNETGRIGLYNPIDGLWWRDKSFRPPYQEPNGRQCYWSRGNGWVYAALVRVMDELNRARPQMGATEQKEIDSMQTELTTDFISMSMALKPCQRADGFWNCSLHDATHCGGPETSGTALFVYGMAWGIRNGLLSPAVFQPIILRAWKGMTKTALQKNGFLGYVQGTGKGPEDGQPLSADKEPDFDDFGVGCFLLAGSEMVRLIDASKK